MTNYARVIDNVAVDVTTDLENTFHPDLAKEFVEVPDKVQRGWVLNGKTWKAPEVVEPLPAPADEPIRTVVTPPQFKLLLTLQERLALRQAAVDDPAIADFLSMLEDPRLTEVDLTNKGVIEAMQYAVSKELLTQERMERILKGQDPL